MCTAVTYKTKNHYFGRNLDLDYSYQETVLITPRNVPFLFREVENINHHYAMIGMGVVVEEYPLYYDATNERGLSMAGLSFPKNAEYRSKTEEKENISPFEFIPWILGQCATIKEVKEKLQNINLVDINFNKELPLAPLHWMISDKKESITVEPFKEGIKVYDNPVGVLTNSPTFDLHMFYLNNYMQLSNKPPKNNFSSKLQLKPYCEGMGAMGMPGDLSSMSRFVRAAFVKLNSISGESEEESISQFFHILSSVRQQRGCVYTGEDTEEENQYTAEKYKYDITVYSSCCNTDKGIYYYTTYENSQITAVDMYQEDLEGEKVIVYPLIKKQQIKMQNVVVI